MRCFVKLCLALSITPLLCLAQQDKEPKSVAFFAAAGVNIETSATGNTSPYHNAGGKNYTSYLPVISGGLNIATDPDYQKVFIRLEVSAAFSKYNSEYNNMTEPYVPVRASFSATDISLNPQVIYNFYNAENLKIYLGAGVSVATSVYSKVHYGPQNPKDYFPVHNDYDFVSFDTRALLKAGVQINKKVELFFNYLTNAERTNRGYFQLNKSNDHIGVVYLF